MRLSNGKVDGSNPIAADKAFWISNYSKAACFRYRLASSQADELGVKWLPFSRPKAKVDEMDPLRIKENRRQRAYHCQRLPTGAVSDGRCYISPNYVRGV